MANSAQKQEVKVVLRKGDKFYRVKLQVPQLLLEAIKQCDKTMAKILLHAFIGAARAIINGKDNAVIKWLAEHPDFEPDASYDERKRLAIERGLGIEEISFDDYVVEGDAFRQWCREELGVNVQDYRCVNKKRKEIGQ